MMVFFTQPTSFDLNRKQNDFIAKTESGSDISVLIKQCGFIAESHL